MQPRILYTLVSFFICVTNSSFAQSVGIGTTTPDASAQLDVSNTSKGILIPRLSSAQRNGISNPATGLLVFQTDGTPGFYYYTGLAWINLTNGNQPNNLGIALSSNYSATTTQAGSGLRGSVNGTGTAATFDYPFGLATDAAGNIYVADTYGNKIRKITPGGSVTTLAGSGTGGYAEGVGTAASFYLPNGAATDADGNIYIADMANNRIRKITPDGNVTTLAGSGTYGSSDGTGAAASFSAPKDVATDASGNVYVADFGNYSVRKITPAGVVTTLATLSTTPDGIATDAAGNIYVAETDNHRIMKITPAGVITVLAGSGASGYAEGTGTAAYFRYPTGLATDAFGNVYVADKNNHAIRKITAEGVVTTLAGNGNPGSVNASGAGSSFYYPTDVAVDHSGNLYVADSNNHLIRKIAIR